MIRIAENLNDIDNDLIQEIIKAKVSCIDIKDKSKKLYIKIYKFGSRIEFNISTLTTPFYWEPEENLILNMMVENQVYSIPAENQLKDLKNYGIDYQKEIDLAIAKDEFIYYDVELSYLIKAIKNHPKEYFSYIVNTGYREAEAIIGSDLWIEIKKKLFQKI